MSIMYKVRRGATIIGGALFLVFGFVTYLMGEQIYEALLVIWDMSQIAIVCLALALFGGALFVWGMGWTMSDRERLKMKKYRKEQKKLKKEREHKKKLLKEAKRKIEEGKLKKV